MQEFNKNTSNNEIDLVELFNILLKYKKFIIFLTVAITIFAYIYVNFITKPIYSGSATLEIGEVINKDNEKGTVDIINLEEIPVLKALVETKFGVTVSALNDSTLLRYDLATNDKNHIKKSLNEAIKFTLDRDKRRAKLYAGSNANVINTSIIVPISISDKPIKPKKKLIVIISFVTGLLFSIFIAFFIEFLSSVKKRRT